MRDVPEALAAHLAGGVTTLCRCWRLTLRSGAVLGFTDHDEDLVFDGIVHRATAGLLASADVERADLGVGGMEISGALAGEGLDAADLESGAYDGAAVELFLVNWAAPAERMRLRRGTLGEVVKADGAFRAEVRGPMNALGAVRGRVFAATCDATLGDGRCGVDLDRPAFRAEAAVSAVDGDRRLRCDALAGFPSGWFSDGRLSFLSGANAGREAFVKVHVAASAGVFLELREAPAAPPFVGDAVVVRAGCDKRFPTCRDKFANAANFRGFPHLPGNDVALGYAAGGVE